MPLFTIFKIVRVHGKNLKLCRTKKWQSMLDSKSMLKYYWSTSVSIFASPSRNVANKFAVCCDEDDNSMTLSKLSPFPSKTIMLVQTALRHSSYYLTNLHHPLPLLPNLMNLFHFFTNSFSIFWTCVAPGDIQIRVSHFFRGTCSKTQAEGKSQK